jgi:hypothetical protein
MGAGEERACEGVCFIGGAPHSGSTLLGMILGAQPGVFYGGELRKSAFLGDAEKPLKKRVCKLCGEACAVWGSLRAPLLPDVYEVLARRTGARVIVDSSKGTEWQREQVRLLRGTRTRIYLIVLERDGRAVLASRLRKVPEADARTLAQRWVDQIARTDAFATAFPGPVLRVAYEALATHPEREVRRITEWVGVAFEPGRLGASDATGVGDARGLERSDDSAGAHDPSTFWEAEQHPLGGNDGTQYLVARERARRAALEQRASPPDGGVLDLVARNLAYYAPHPPTIRLDQRWREELDAPTLARFEEVAGAANERFAWPRP